TWESRPPFYECEPPNWRLLVRNFRPCSIRSLLPISRAPPLSSLRYSPATTLSSAEPLPSNERIPVRPSVATEYPPDASQKSVWSRTTILHEHEQIPRDNDDHIVD